MCEPRKVLTQREQNIADAIATFSAERYDEFVKRLALVMLMDNQEDIGRSISSIETLIDQQVETINKEVV